MDGLGMTKIDNGSQKTILKMMAENPWSAAIINEFSPYLKIGSWQSDVIPQFVDVYDGKSISMCSEKSGRLRINKAAPSLLFGVQPQLFMDIGVYILKSMGFLARATLAVDDTVLPDYTSVGAFSSTVEVDTAPIIDAFQLDYDWLPPAMSPAQECHLQEGFYNHPMALTNLKLEQYEYIFQRHTIASEFAGEANRFRDNLLPLVSIPFESKENLRQCAITTEAMRRGERLLLSYYWALAKYTTNMPETPGEKLITRMVAVVNGCHDAGITQHELRKRVKYQQPRDFENAVAVIVDRGLVRVEKFIPKNSKDTSLRFWPLNAAPSALEPIPKFERGARTPKAMVVGDDPFEVCLNGLEVAQSGRIEDEF